MADRNKEPGTRNSFEDLGLDHFRILVHDVAESVLRTDNEWLLQVLVNDES